MRWWPFVWKSEYKHVCKDFQQSCVHREEKWAAVMEAATAVEILTEQKVRLSKERAALEDEIAGLRDELRGMDSILRTYINAAFAEAKAGDEAMTELAKVQKENQVLRTAMRGQEVASAEQSKAMVDLKTELGVIVEAFNSLSDEKAGIETQMTNSDAEYLRLLTIIENLEAALSAANEEIVKSAFQISNLEYTISIKNEINHGHTETIEELKKNLSDEKEAVEEINRDRDAKDSCLMRLAEERAVIALAGELAARYGMRITQELADEERGGVMDGYERIDL
jgi:chromosome segregation ATPase